MGQTGDWVARWDVLDPLVIIWAGPLPVMGVCSSGWVGLSLRGPCVLLLRIQNLTLLGISAQMLLLLMLGSRDLRTEALPLFVGVSLAAASFAGKVAVIGP